MVLKESVKNVLNYGTKQLIYFSKKYDYRLAYHLNMRIVIHVIMKQSWRFSNLHNKHPELNSDSRLVVKITMNQNLEDIHINFFM